MNGQAVVFLCISYTVFSLVCVPYPFNSPLCQQWMALKVLCDTEEWEDDDVFESWKTPFMRVCVLGDRM